MHSRHELRTVERQHPTGRRLRGSTRAPGVDWEALYHRLRDDPEDEGAWLALQQRIRVWARAVLRASGVDLVEDVVLETCAAVAIDIDRAYGGATFAGFVYGQFLTVRRRLLRTLAARRRTCALGGIDVAAPAVEDELDPEIVDRLYQALHALPARERRAVALRYLEGATTAQIAADLAVSETNARQLVFRGLKRLRASLRQAA